MRPLRPVSSIEVTGESLKDANRRIVLKEEEERQQRRLADRMLLLFDNQTALFLLPSAALRGSIRNDRSEDLETFYLYRERKKKSRANSERRGGDWIWKKRLESSLVVVVVPRKRRPPAVNERVRSAAFDHDRLVQLAPFLFGMFLVASSAAPTTTGRASARVLPLLTLSSLKQTKRQLQLYSLSPAETHPPGGEVPQPSPTSATPAASASSTRARSMTTCPARGCSRQPTVCVLFLRG